MTSRRTAKLASAIRESVSSTILFGLKDPRVKNVTVLGVDVADDLRSAKVYISIMGDEKMQSLTMHGLNSARGFIQAKVADRLQTRYTPILSFIIDDGIKKSIAAAALIREAMANQANDAHERTDTREIEAPNVAGEDAHEPVSDLHASEDESEETQDQE